MESIADQDLLILIRHDDKDAFTTLFDRYWQRLFQSAKARLGGDDAAKDIVQEIFIKLWQRRSDLNIKGPLENYLQGAVRLSVISHYNSKKVNQVLLEDSLDRINILEDSIESLTDYLDMEQTLTEAVELMPEMLKKIYQLRSENLSVREIAGTLGLAEQTVKNYISEVLRRLRIVIAQKYPEKHLTYMAVLAAMLYN
ncbi:RNA polymerase sigma factor [Pedobacter nyackensis]|uniref:RNA polymerase sigma factor n=1 Tax=Pedobacter nyackensis TaxID=475255 RepID=UPI00292DFF70|nr:sigma-70 family RNA polymerase sigma factor [Pedobacter nyackensis]